MSCIYGPHQFGTEDQGWVAHFLIARAATASRSPSTATASRCATSCSSTIWSTRSLARAARTSTACPGQAFNIGGGPATRSACSSCSTQHRASCTASAPELRVRATGGPAISATTCRTRGASRAATGWAPRVGVREGLARLYRLAARSRDSRLAHPLAADAGGVMKVALINPAVDVRRQHLLRLPRAAPAARVRVRAGAARARRARGPWSSTGSSTACRPERMRAQRRATSRPTSTVVTTAPSYLFWRCAPPELRVPMRGCRARCADVPGRDRRRRPARLDDAAARRCEARTRTSAVLGECEEMLPRLARRRGEWDRRRSRLAYRRRRRCGSQGGPHACDMAALPALRWPARAIARHAHHHHRFDAAPTGPGAEMETSRGCPYHCTFCAKENFRDAYRKRPLPRSLDELDGLIAAGRRVRLLHRRDLPARSRRCSRRWRRAPVQFGVQTRIDLWSREMLDLLGEAGCVSIEAGVESITEEGRDLLDKHCRLIDRRADRAADPRQAARAVRAGQPDRARVRRPEAVEAWRQQLQQHGVWANEPVPLFPYPGSPDYTQRWGAPDDRAWERAHEHYLGASTSSATSRSSVRGRSRELERRRRAR